MLQKKYRRISNIVQLLTRRDTRIHLVSLSASTRKRFWNWINSIRNHRDPYPPLVVNGKVMLIRQMSLTGISTNEDNSNLHKILPSHAPSINVNRIDFTSELVFEELVKLDSTKACGPDSIPPILLKKVLLLSVNH